MRSIGKRLAGGFRAATLAASVPIWATAAPATYIAGESGAGAGQEPRSLHAPPPPALISLELERTEILRGGLPLPECMTLVIARIAYPAEEGCDRRGPEAGLAGREIAFHWAGEPSGVASDRPLLFAAFAETDENGEAFAYVLSGFNAGRFRLAASYGASRFEKTLRQVSASSPGVMVGRAPEFPAEPAEMDEATRERIDREIARLNGRDPEDALKNLAGFGRAAMARLARAAFDPSSPAKVRELCGRAIGRIRDEEALRALVGMLTDRRPGIQQVAEWGMRSRGMDSAAPFLRLSMDSRCAHVKAGALRAAAEFRDPEWRVAAAAAMKDPDPYVRACAAWCMVRSAASDSELPALDGSKAGLGGDAPRPGLADLLSDPVPAVRRSAVASICRRIGEEIALARMEYRPARDAAGGYSVESLVSALNDMRPAGRLLKSLCGLAALAARTGDEDTRGTLRAGLEAAIAAERSGSEPAANPDGLGGE